MIVQERRNRLTGTVVQIIDNRNESFDQGGERWVTVCDDHGYLCGHSTRRLAEWHAPVPEWCDVCQEIIEGREIPR